MSVNTLWVLFQSIYFVKGEENMSNVLENFIIQKFPWSGTRRRTHNKYFQSSQISPSKYWMMFYLKSSERAMRIFFFFFMLLQIIIKNIFILQMPKMPIFPFFSCIKYFFFAIVEIRSQFLFLFLFLVPFLRLVQNNKIYWRISTWKGEQKFFLIWIII